MGCFRMLAAMILAVAVLIPGAASAQAAKTFAVLPFTINGPDKYQYLGRGIQDMLISRLTWADKFIPMDKEKVASAVSAAPASDSAASALLPELGTDYLVWGSVTILGDQCSVDVRTTGAEGTSPESAQTTIGGLIPALETIAKDVNAKVFKRELAPKEAKSDSKRVNRMNPELVHNERSAAQEFYINPQFRYQGGADTPGRWRSPTLPFTSLGLVVGDADADGENELFFLSEHSVHAYRMSGEKFQPLDTITPGGRVELLNINLIDMNRDGFQEIVVSGFFEEGPLSYILNFRNGKFTIVGERIKFFMNVAKLPPTYQPTLIGQLPGRNNVLTEEPVNEVVKIGGSYQLGKRVPLPKKANAFNFAFLPQKGTDYKIMIVDPQDHIQIYTPKFDLQATTMEQYAGSAIGFKIKDTFPGFNPTEDQFINVYYLPLRLLVTDLDKNGEFEVLVNKNISMAAQFFNRYRFFPNGEIHSMFWDGVGMSLAWKTRRIKGTVADYGVNDINNDGTTDLFVCLNTYPGPAGVSERKTMVLAYTLDLESTDAPLDKESE